MIVDAGNGPVDDLDAVVAPSAIDADRQPESIKLDVCLRAWLNHVCLLELRKTAIAKPHVKKTNTNANADAMHKASFISTCNTTINMSARGDTLSTARHCRQ
jgi:hypothetical protein